MVPASKGNARQATHPAIEVIDRVAELDFHNKDCVVEMDGARPAGKRTANLITPQERSRDRKGLQDVEGRPRRHSGHEL